LSVVAGGKRSDKDRRRQRRSGKALLQPLRGSDTLNLREKDQERPAGRKTVSSCWEE
ncbi:hypothetical protein U1Q18_048035, partial [Sarracenia purpurea var. burkii]